MPLQKPATREGAQSAAIELLERVEAERVAPETVVATAQAWALLAATLPPAAAALPEPDEQPDVRSLMASTEEALQALPSGTVVRGPEFHSEVYEKHGRHFWAPGSEGSWTAKMLVARGPYRILFQPEVRGG